MRDFFKGAIMGSIVAAAIGSLGALMINSRYEEVNRDNEALRLKVTNSVPFEERSLNGNKWYVIDLESKVQSGDYMLTTEESNGCKILSSDAKVNPGNYKLMFIETTNSLESLVPLDSSTFPSNLESEKENLPYAIPGTNKLDPIEAKRLGLHSEGYIVKPHPYKEGGFIIQKDADSEKFKGNKTSMRIRNQDGSIHYNVQVRDEKGNLLREYIEPSNERIEKNPDYKPETENQFYSTMPVMKNPDGSIYAYRLLKMGETLEDVIKEGPIDVYIPKKSSK